VGVFRQLGDPLAAGVCLCQHHGAAYAERTSSGGFASPTLQSDDLADNTTIIQQAITTTERCCIVVNAAAILPVTATATAMEIERPLGAIRTTQEDSITTGNIHLTHHAAWEVLPAGTHTYHLVNRSGGVLRTYGSWLKIIASDCEA